MHVEETECVCVCMCTYLCMHVHVCRNWGEGGEIGVTGLEPATNMRRVSTSLASARVRWDSCIYKLAHLSLGFVWM